MCRVTIFISGLLLISGATTACSSLHPSDAKIIAHFEKHRDAAERLLRRLEQDSKVYGVSLKDGIVVLEGFYGIAAPKTLDLSPQDLSEYNDLMRELGLREVNPIPDWVKVSPESKGHLLSVEMISSWRAQGAWISYKGFAYRKDTERLGTEVDDTVKFVPHRETPSKAYRHIVDDWYVVVCFIPSERPGTSLTL